MYLEKDSRQERMPGPMTALFRDRLCATAPAISLWEYRVERDERGVEVMREREERIEEMRARWMERDRDSGREERRVEEMRGE